MSLCIIGAGMAGLCCARHALKNKIPFTVFEQTDIIGGTWVFTNEVGTNKFGLDVHSSMYYGLRIIDRCPAFYLNAFKAFQKPRPTYFMLTYNWSY